MEEPKREGGREKGGGGGGRRRDGTEDMTREYAIGLDSQQKKKTKHKNMEPWLSHFIKH